MILVNQSRCFWSKPVNVLRGSTAELLGALDRPLYDVELLERGLVIVHYIRFPGENTTKPRGYHLRTPEFWYLLLLGFFGANITNSNRMSRGYEDCRQTPNSRRMSDTSARELAFQTTRRAARRLIAGNLTVGAAL